MLSSPVLPFCVQSLSAAEAACHFVGKAKSDILVCAGQNISQIDSLFVGDILGKKSDIADGSLRDWDFRKFNNLVGDYWIAPTFLDSMGVRSDHAQTLCCLCTNSQATTSGVFQKSQGLLQPTPRQY